MRVLCFNSSTAPESALTPTLAPVAATNVWLSCWPKFNDRVPAANERVLEIQQKARTPGPDWRLPIGRNRHSWGISPESTVTTRFANRRANRHHLRIHATATSLQANCVETVRGFAGIHRHDAIAPTMPCNDHNAPCSVNTPDHNQDGSPYTGGLNCYSSPGFQPFKSLL